VLYTANYVKIMCLNLKIHILLYLQSVLMNFREEFITINLRFCRQHLEQRKCCYGLWAYI